MSEIHKKHSKKQESPEKQQKSGEYEHTIAEITDQLLRLQAEFENYQKRVEKEQIRHKQAIEGSIMKELLPMVDSFEQALTQSEDAGVQGLYTQLTQVLAAHGVKEIESVGKPFDPHTQECVVKENNTEKPDNSVLEEIQKGYIIGERVLRTAKVTVNAHD
jgi:molecular chaperone GrpE